MATVTEHGSIDSLTTAEIMAAVAGPTASPAEADVDRYADCARVWCEFASGVARVVDGFCECCGAQDHDCA